MRQARQAMELEQLGELHYNNSAHFLADGSDLCYNVPQNDVMIGDTTVFTNRLLGVTPVCKFDADRSNVLYLLGCTVFYITFSDSASFMVDIFASNGRKNTH
jgi:hypothetical protein